MSALSGPVVDLLAPSFLRKLESLRVVARSHASGRERGERTSRHVGRGIAFASHRAYASGDDVRFVDWKLFARSDRLYVKLFEEERDLSLHLLLDCSASMAHGAGAKFRRASELAAALGYLALASLDRVSVQPYRDEPMARLAPLRGRTRALVLLRYLASLVPGGLTDLRAAARSVCVHEKRGGLGIVISDGLDEASLLPGVDLLRHGRIEPVVLLVKDPDEASVGALGEVTLVDRESGRERTLFVNECVRERYRQGYRAHFAALVQALRKRGVRAVELDVGVPLERAVLELLRRAEIVA